MKKAQSLIEYTLILVLISLIAVATLHFMGKHMSFNKDSQNLDSNKNIVETMTIYCKNQGLTYNEKTEKCE